MARYKSQALQQTIQQHLNQLNIVSNFNFKVLGQFGHRFEAEVMGFNDATLYLLPFTKPQGIGPGAKVSVLRHTSQMALSPELLGQVWDGRSQPLDGRPAQMCTDMLSLQGLPINPMARGPIWDILDVALKPSTAC